MNFPIIKNGDFALLVAKKDTGIILNKEFKFLDGDTRDDPYYVFNNLDLIYEFIKELDNDQLEYIVYDSQKNVINIDDNTPPQSLLT